MQLTADKMILLSERIEALEKEVVEMKESFARVERLAAVKKVSEKRSKTIESQTMTLVVPAIPIRGGAIEGDVTRSLHTSDTLIQFWKGLLKRAFVLSHSNELAIPLTLAVRQSYWKYVNQYKPIKEYFEDVLCAYKNVRMDDEVITSIGSRLNEVGLTASSHSSKSWKKQISRFLEASSDAELETIKTEWALKEHIDGSNLFPSSSE